ncbi:MAG: GAF domain-containing protein [Deltaproteobacteria bacterium]|nr:MAG: GAF domain-containing protein [Deltaproteobacteria bacterium]
MQKARPFTCSLVGFFLGLLAPAGWFLIRYCFFRGDGQPFWQFFSAELAGSPVQGALYSYMGLGTAVVFACFGYLIGRAMSQLDERAHKLAALHENVQKQRNAFESRFTSLHDSLKNLHIINAQIQKANTRTDIIRLAGEGLHGILGYDRVNIWLVDEARQQLVLALSLGTGFRDKLALPLDERLGVIYRTVLDGRPRLVEDMRALGHEDHLAEEFASHDVIRSRTFVLCPVKAGNRVLGLFGVDNKTSRRQLSQTDVDTIRLFAEQTAMSLSRVDLLGAVESLTRELSRTFESLPQFRHQYTELSGHLVEAGRKNRLALADMSGAADIIQEAVDETRSASGEISVSIQQVSENINSLHGHIDETASAVNEITATLQTVHDNAGTSEELTETVQNRAHEGVERLLATLDALKAIHQAVQKSTRKIHQLSTLADGIGDATALIGEIAGKTNLLALNAAIIAAQAGEHGSSFSVVADEIRVLAGDAARSAEDIEHLVAQIRQATSEGVDQISMTNHLVDQGVSSGRELEVALQQVVADAERSTTRSREIRRATSEVARSAHSINAAVARIREMAEQVAHASREQASGMKSIVHAIEEIKTMTDGMVASVDNQEKGMDAIEQAIEQIGRMAQMIFQDLENRRQMSQEVVEKVGTMRHAQED